MYASRPVYRKAQGRVSMADIHVVGHVGGHPFIFHAPGPYRDMTDMGAVIVNRLGPGASSWMARFFDPGWSWWWAPSPGSRGMLARGEGAGVPRRLAGQLKTCSSSAGPPCLIPSVASIKILEHMAHRRVRQVICQFRVWGGRNSLKTAAKGVGRGATIPSDGTRGLRAGVGGRARA